MAFAYYIKLYWGPRSETVRSCAERYARWLHDLGRIEPLFAHWYLLGRSRREALKRQVIPTAEYIERRFVKSKTYPELEGWDETFWAPGAVKGEDARIKVYCGEQRANALNTAELKLPSSGLAAERVATRDVMLRLMECSVRAWEPDDALVMSYSYWNILPVQTPDVIWGGWMVYFSRAAGRIPPLPAPAEIVPVDDLGSIIIFTPEPFLGTNPEHVTWANRLVDLLTKAGLRRASRG